MDRRREIQIEWAQFSTIPPVNMDRIAVASADDVHIKYFHRLQSPTTTGLPAKFNSVQRRRRSGGQCLGQIMIQR